MQNTVLNHVKAKPILNIQLKSVKSVKKNINLYERQVSSVLLNVVLQIRKIEAFNKPSSIGFIERFLSYLIE